MANIQELPAGNKSPWVHHWAVATVCATFVLLILGAVVTTFRVGMADPVWPTYPWHLLLISWREPGPGFIVEHAHRLAGYIVGCLIIVLAASLWRSEPRRWVRLLGFAALAGVILQGLLGGFRVKLNELVGTDLALIHGVFAQVVFCLLVSLALFTSRGWISNAPVTSAGLAGLKRMSLLVSGLLFLQLFFGALLRHTHSSLGQRGHVLIAFAVVAAVVSLVKSVLENPATAKPLRTASVLLAVLVTGQLVLGVESWLARSSPIGLPELQAVTVPQAIVRSAHVLMGSLVLGASVVVTLRAHRQTICDMSLTSAPSIEPREEAA